MKRVRAKKLFVRWWDSRTCDYSTFQFSRPKASNLMVVGVKLSYLLLAANWAAHVQKTVQKTPSTSYRVHSSTSLAQITPTSDSTENKSSAFPYFSTTLTRSTLPQNAYNSMSQGPLPGSHFMDFIFLGDSSPLGSSAPREHVFGLCSTLHALP